MSKSKVDPIVARLVKKGPQTQRELRMYFRPDREGPFETRLRNLRAAGRIKTGYYPVSKQDTRQVRKWAKAGR